MPQRPGPLADARPAFGSLLQAHPGAALALVAASVMGWLFLAWLAMDMETPVAQLAMPMSRHWTVPNLIAVWTMWSVMMIAMMLPSALPMILTFVQVAQRSGEHVRGLAFVAAYVIVWLGFGTLGVTAQWVLQHSGLVDAMAVSRSSPLTAVLLLLAGVYQFSPLKRACLLSCRSPMGFLLGQWRPGVGGGFTMGLRHGLLCLGCCWALMGLLFVGGMMNVPWVAALAVAVAIEKLAPDGARIGTFLGLALIIAGVIRLASTAG